MNVNVYEVGKAFYEWLSQFATVYRGTLPSGIQPDEAYILYTGYTERYATQYIQPIKIYKRKSTSYTPVIFIANNIAAAVGEGGILVKKDNVTLKIEQGSPFYQDMPDEDETTKAGYVNLLITIF